MSNDNRPGQKANRRTVLKSLGAATALSTAGVSVGSAGSGRSFDEILEQSHRVLQAAGPEKQHEFLRNRGVGTAMDSATTKLGGGGPSTEKLVTDEISLWFSVYDDCGTGSWPNGTYVAELTWQYDASWDDTGDDPMDFAGIGWDDNTWYYEDNNLDDMYVSHPDFMNYYDGSSGNGPAWEVNDVYTLDETRSDDYFFTGVHLDWNGSNSQKDNRTISASYSHTWSSVNITGVSVSYPYGVSVSVGDESKEWVKDTNDSGEFLRLRYDDIEGCA